MAWDLPSHPANEVRTREDLAAFVAALRDDFIRSGTEWENQTLDRFLDALSTWIAAAPGWYSNFGQEIPAEGDWVFLARAFAAAVVYE